MPTPTHRNVPSWTLGDRLRKARETAGISSQEMADALLVSRNTIRNYESGQTTNIPAVKVGRWAELTRVPVEWLLAGAETAADQAISSSPCTTASSSFLDGVLRISVAA